MNHGFWINLTVSVVLSLLVSACGKYHQKESLPRDLDALQFQADSIYLRPVSDPAYLAAFKQLSDGKKPASGAYLNDIPDFLSISQFEKARLDNGLQMFLLPTHDLPVITLAVLVEAGKHQTNDHGKFISPLVLKLLKQGTEKYSKSDFDKRSALLGSTIHYNQTARFSILSVSILPQDLSLALDLLSQQLIHLKPDNRALSTIIEQYLLETRLSRSAGDFLAKERFYQNNYTPEHPYHPVYWDRQSVKNTRLEQLMHFYQQYYRAERTKIILVGDLKQTQSKAMIERYFSQWDSFLDPPVVDTVLTKHSIEEVSRIDLIDRPDAQQANILYGHVTVNGQDNDLMGLTILASILGGGPSSRLFTDLREKQGLTYSISATQRVGQYRSPFLIETAVAHDKVILMIKGITQHMNYLCHHKISDRELELIKQQLWGEMTLRFQSHQQKLNEKIRLLEIDHDEEYIAQQFQQLKHITAEQLFSLSQKYLCKSHQFIVAGQADKLKTLLRQHFRDNLYE